jgi:hypothetical protein
MAVLYAAIPDLRTVLQSTDGGVGTPAELSDSQLSLALSAASNRISVYFGSVMDGSSQQATAPDIFHDLTLDLAVFFSWRTYLKGKVMPNDHPAYLAYQNAMQMLNDVRDGKLRLDPAVAGLINEETGTVINRIPNIFTGNDSNTRRNPLTGFLESDVPFGQWAPRGDESYAGNAGPVYQG